MNTGVRRVLLLTRYSDLGASSRVRLLSYIDLLESIGFEVEVQCFFDTAYLRRRYSGASRFSIGLSALQCAVRRLIFLVRERYKVRYDVVWIQSEVFPYAPRFLEVVGHLGNVVVYDFDDAIHFRLERSAFRRFSGSKFRDIASTCPDTRITAGNAFLSNWALSEGFQKVFTVPSVVPRDQVRIPFLIGSGFHASLFVTEILGGPVDADSFCPRVSCMFDHLTLQSLENRKKIFVTLVLLLGRMKMSIGNLSNDSLPTLRGRRKLRQQVSRNILSKRIKSNKLSSAGALSTGQAEEQANSRGDRRDESENMAMEAVMKFCPETTHLVYPWPRYRSIFGGDESQFYQQSSPFHFRGECLGSDVFYKVWRQGDDCVDELWVEREVSLLRHALTCGVSVPSVLRFGRLQASNHVFLALQLEDLGDLHFAHRRDELMIYARSLINNVSKLHSKAKILHCDLKPENVVWNGTNVLLLDFGRAQRIGEVVPVPGTSGFEAPEVEQGLANTCSTDAFSVGKLLLAAINRFERKDKAVQYLQSIGEGLCVPERQHRLSLKDADSKLKEFERRHMRPSHKKAKIVEKERGLGVKTLSLIT